MWDLEMPPIHVTSYRNHGSMRVILLGETGSEVLESRLGGTVVLQCRRKLHCGRQEGSCLLRRCPRPRCRGNHRSQETRNAALANHRRPRNEQNKAAWTGCGCSSHKTRCHHHRRFGPQHTRIQRPLSRQLVEPQTLWSSFLALPLPCGSETSSIICMSAKVVMMKQSGAYIDPGDINPHLICQFTFEAAVWLRVLVELPLERLHLVLG